MNISLSLLKVIYDMFKNTYKNTKYKTAIMLIELLFEIDHKIIRKEKYSIQNKNFNEI